MITEEEVEAAVGYLRDNAPYAAQARAEHIYLEQYLKTVLAQEMTRCDPSQSMAERERQARISEPYVDVLKAYREAVQVDERNRFLREAASARIDAWRTLEATHRAEGRAS